jgi:tyrosine-specific transport protein
MQFPRALVGLGLLIGMIVGAGIFALPYAIAQSGLFWGGFHFVLVAVIVIIIQILYGNVLYDHPEKHRLPGYVKSVFGERIGSLSIISRLFAYFGYLLAYGSLAALFLNLLFKDLSLVAGAFIFYVLLSVPLFFNLRRAGKINLYLTIPLVIFPFVLFGLLYNQLDFSSLVLFPTNANWFFPYGIFLFAMAGVSVIPEVTETLGKKGRGQLKHIVIFGTILISAIYIFFMAAILGVAGSDVPRDSLSALNGIDGGIPIIIGAVIGLLAVTTSFLALGLELRYTLQYDLKFKKAGAWALVVMVPLVLYLMGIQDFILIIAVIGAIGAGIEGTFITLLSRKISNTNMVLVSFLTIVLILGALLEVADVLGYL